MPTNRATRAASSTPRRAKPVLLNHPGTAAADCDRAPHSDAPDQVFGRGPSRREGSELCRRQQPCHHSRTTHQHGSRAAYVRDRCRCGPCRAANAAATAAARRNRILGRFPLVDATDARNHLLALRSAGVGVHRLAALTGISVSHVRALMTLTVNGQPAVTRVHPRTASRILTVLASPQIRSSNVHVPARGTVRRLQALQAIGWNAPELARRLGRNPQSVRRTMTGQLVTAATADAVADLYDALWDLAPTGQRANVTRAEARLRAWAPPMAWDNIDTDDDPAAPSTQGEDLDEVAIERALARDGVTLRDLNRAEQCLAVDTLTHRGLSISQIADVLCTTPRTVSRRRAINRTVRSA